MSGVIAIQVGAAPRLLSRTLLSSVPNTENPLVEVSLSPFGFLQTTEGSGGGVVTNRIPEWWGNSFSSGFGVGRGFQARCEIFSGDAPNGGSSPINTWLDMSIAPVFWQLFRNTTGTLTGVWTVFIRSAGTGTVLASAIYTMTATKNP